VFVGYPLQVSHLLADYLKRKKNQRLECCIVRTDLSLLAEEIREAAHLRWHIEKNSFKRLSCSPEFKSKKQHLEGGKGPSPRGYPRGEGMR